MAKKTVDVPNGHIVNELVKRVNESVRLGPRTDVVLATVRVLREDPKLARALLSRQRPVFDTSSLTPTQVTIIQYMAVGMIDTAIARQIAVSERTVRRQIQAIMLALGAHSRVELGILLAARRLTDRAPKKGATQ